MLKLSKCIYDYYNDNNNNNNINNNNKLFICKAVSHGLKIYNWGDDYANGQAKE